MRKPARPRRKFRSIALFSSKVLIALGAVFLLFFLAAAVAQFLLSLFPKTPAVNSPAASPTASLLPAASPPPAAPLPPAAFPPPATDDFFQADYTELFSGTGWQNAARSTAHHDVRTTVISFPPAYELLDEAGIAAALGNDRVIAARGSGSAVLALTDRGNIVGFGSSAEAVRMPFFSDGGETERFTRGAVAYDESRRVWVVAGEHPRGVAVAVFAFSPSAQRGSFAREGAAEARLPSSAVAGDARAFSLGCARGQCLLAAQGALYAFRESSPALSRFAPESVPAGAVSLSAGNTDSLLLVGAVSSRAKGSAQDAYEGRIIELFPSDLSFRDSRALFSSRYSGVVRMGWDPDARKALAVYAAYEGAAFEFDIGSGGGLGGNPPRDLSRFFGARVFGGKSIGEISVVPDIAGAGGAWWLSPAAGEGALLWLFRGEGGIVSDLSGMLSEEGSGGVVAARAFAPRGAYLFFTRGGAPKAARVEDKGFNFLRRTVAWESARLNSKDGNVVKAILTRREDSGAVRYAFSNDGGAAWIPAEERETVRFPKRGGDFRFRVELGASADPFGSAWVDVAAVQYFVDIDDGGRYPQF